MAATSTQLRRRSAARRDALARQQKLNEERRRRDEQELELAAEFAIVSDEYAAARDAVRSAELALGRVVDRLIGDLRIRYDRAAHLLEMPEDELRRLRQLVTNTAKRPPSRRRAGKRASSASESGTEPQAEPVQRPGTEQPSTKP